MTKRRILIVEDDLSVLEVMLDVLEELDYDVDSAGTLYGARDLLDEHDRYDVCIVDGNFPVTEGGGPQPVGEHAIISIGHHALKHDYQPSIIVCSGEPIESEELADRYNAQFLAKPFCTDDFASVIGYAMLKAELAETSPIEGIAQKG